MNTINKKQLRPWWLRKRILFAVLFPIALIAAVVIAIIRSNDSSIIVYNETGHTLPPLIIRACGQSRAVNSLEDEDSICFNLKAAGTQTPVHLELATDPPWSWDGQLIKPDSGNVITIRLRPNGDVEAYNALSWWQQLLK